jgi:hypothetical protein
MTRKEALRLNGETEDDGPDPAEDPIVYLRDRGEEEEE